MGGRGASSFSVALSTKGAAIAAMLKDRGYEINQDGTVTLYHATASENVSSILKEGFKGNMSPIAGGATISEPVAARSFFGLDREWVEKNWNAFGGTVMEVRVPVQYIRQGAGSNNKEVYIEGNLKKVGRVWLPDREPTSTFYDRLAVKRYMRGR